MNEITKRAIQNAIDSKKKPPDDPVKLADWFWEFYYRIILDEYAYPLKYRAMHLYRLFCPDLIEQEGDFLWTDDWDLDCLLSDISVSVLRWKIDHNPDLQLSPGWQEEINKYAHPQIRLGL